MERFSRLAAYAIAGGFVALTAAALIFIALRGWAEGGPLGMVLGTVALGLGGLWAAWLAAQKFRLIWTETEVRPPRPERVEPNSLPMTALYLLLLLGPATVNFLCSRLMGYPLDMSLGGAFLLLLWGWVLLRQFQAGTRWSYWLVLTLLYFLPAFLPLLLGWGGE